MKSIFPLCLALLLISCSGDDDKPTTCGVKSPTTQLPWLKEAIEEYNEPDFMDVSVEQGEYNSQTVFIVIPCCPTCDMLPPPVYNCEGQEIAGLASFDNDITHRKVIWKTPANKAGCW
jgi:hypothetical protein